MKKHIYIFSAILFFTSCVENQNEGKTGNSNSDAQNENSASSLSVPTALDKNLYPYTDFTYLPASGGEFFTERGTKITIPKNLFVYKSGERVDKKVTIKFKEFHTPGEIITSGIPMEFDSSGVKKVFQSAGMFEIRAFVEGEPVDVAKGESYEVELASNMDGDFNFYQLNDNSQNWKELAKAQKASPNKRKKIKDNEIKRQLAELKKPVAPKAYRTGDFVFDININTSHFPEFEALNGLMWQYAGKDPKKDPRNNSSFFAREWKVVKITPLDNNKYRINFTRKSDSMSIVAIPIFQGAQLTSENKKFKEMLDNYNDQYNAAINAQFQNEREMSLLRKYNLESMGIYNYDRYYHNPEAIPLLASFNFGKKVNLKSNPISVFLIPKGDNAVIRYVPDTYEKFGFDPTKVNMLIAVLPDNTISTFSNSGFKSIKRDKQGQRQRFMFDMTLEEDRITNPKDIDDMLANNK